MTYVSGADSRKLPAKKIASKAESGDGSDMYKQMCATGPGKGDKDGSKDARAKSGFSSDCPALTVNGPRTRGGK
jgi:hypothetical protein